MQKHLPSCIPNKISLFVTLENTYIMTKCVTKALDNLKMDLNLINAIPKHAGPEGKGSNPTTGLTLLWARNHFRGNFNLWRVSRKQVYTWTDYKTNAQIAKELKITPILNKLLEYKRSWIQHVNRMTRNRLPRVMKRYCPTGRRNRGRPLKGLLDTWDRNGSTSGSNPWQIHHYYY